MITNPLQELWRNQVDWLHASRRYRWLRFPMRSYLHRRHGMEVNRMQKIQYLTAKLFWGDKMTVTPPEQVSSFLYRNGSFEEGLTTALLGYLHPGMVFYDIGAHYGYFTRLAAAIVGNSGAVYAFEPTPSTHEILRQNTKDLAQVQTIQKAVYSHDRTITIRDYGIENSAFNSMTLPRDKRINESDFVAHKVLTISIDGFVTEGAVAPDFVKIDAESAELDILEGMHHTLSKYQPVIAVEVGDEVVIPGVALSQEIVSKIIEYEYRPFEYKRGRWAPHNIREQYHYDNILFLHNSSAAMSLYS